MQNIAFQEANFLNIITSYITISFDKTACRISLLGGKVYIQELIIIVYPRHYLEVLHMDLYVFLALASWLKKNTA